MDELLDINTTLKYFNSITTIEKGKERVESAIVKLLKVEINELRNEVKTKNVMIQTMLENQTQIMRDCTKSFLQPQKDMTKSFYHNQTSCENEFQFPKKFTKAEIRNEHFEKPLLMC